MKVKATYLFVLVFAFLFCGIASKAEAQPSLGIIWHSPTDTSEAVNQLHMYEKYGIEYIQLQHPVHTEVLGLLRSSPLTFIIQLDKAYLTLSEIRSQQNILLQEYGEIVDLYRSNLNVAAIGLLKNSQTFHTDFMDGFTPIIDSLSIQSNKEFYFYSNKDWYYFRTPEEPFATLYPDSVFQRKDIITFDEQFHEKTEQNSELIFFMTSKWFDEALNSYPEFSESLLMYKNNYEWQIPLPESEKSDSPQNWMIILLVLLWVCLAILFKFLPYLRPMLMRHFLAHRFYVDDILHYRERALTGGISLMSLHAVFSGMVFFIIAKSSISEAGLEAFFHHLPVLAIAGPNFASLFIIGVIITLIVQAIALLWLYLPAKNLEHFSQAVNLYACTFFLDYLTVTILVTLFVTGSGLPYILSIGTLFIVIWYAAFNLSAIDISRNLGPQKSIYLLLTIGLHTVISVGLIILLFTSTSWIQVIDLAISL